MTVDRSMLICRFHTQSAGTTTTESKKLRVQKLDHRYSLSREKNFSMCFYDLLIVLPENYRYCSWIHFKLQSNSRTRFIFTSYAIIRTKLFVSRRALFQRAPSVRRNSSWGSYLFPCKYLSVYNTWKALQNPYFSHCHAIVWIISNQTCIQWKKQVYRLNRTQ